jgi:hypothetical protein
MAINLGVIWEFANSLLVAGDEFVEDKVESIFGTFSLWLNGLVADTETKFDDNSVKIIKLGIRDKLIKEYPLEEYPVD